MFENCLLMEAIDYVDDKYLIKYFKMKENMASRKDNKKFRIIKWSALIAACLCLVVTVSICAPYLLKQQEQATVITPPVTTVWADPALNENVSDYFDLSALGTVIITDTLKAEMKCADYDDSALFAVTVTDAAGSEKTYIYNSFIKELNIKEDYLGTGIIFLTRKQIDTLECPSDLAIILSLASNPYE